MNTAKIAMCCDFIFCNVRCLSGKLWEALNLFVQGFGLWPRENFLETRIIA